MMKIALAAIALAACGHGPPRGRAVTWAESGVDWSRPPAVPPAAPFVPPRIDERTLPNGLRVIVVENHRLPLVAITTLHTSAGSREDGAQHGLAALTLDVLDQGAGDRDADELAAALDRAGARLETAIATDHAGIHVTTLSDHATDTIALLADVLRRPHLADADVARARTARVADLEARRALPRGIAARAFDRLVFGAHPYAHPADGAPDTVRALDAAAVRAFWRRAYAPATTTIILVGDVTRDAAERELARAFGDWQTSAAPATPPPPPAHHAPALAVVDTPGAAQAIVMIGGLAGPTGAATQLDADVANVILGGSEGSRVDRELRDRALSIGASTSFWRGEWAGTWAAAATFRTDQAGAGIHAALALIDDARTTDPTADELARARATLATALDDAFETDAGTARAIQRAVAQGLPLSSFATLSARLAALTPASVRAAAAPAWQDLSIVVVGDWRALAPQLADLHLPVVRLDP